MKKKKNNLLILSIDFLLSFILLFLLVPFFLLIVVIVFVETGSPFFAQKRLGRNKKVFTIFKFRTMVIGTKNLSTHLIGEASITKSGKLLRKYKLDEIPQLFNVLIGDMSIVGPRPCLASQLKVISEREKRNVFSVRPGITGHSQIQGIDMSNPILLATTDENMIVNYNIKSYFKILILTALGKGSGDRINLDT